MNSGFLTRRRSVFILFITLFSAGFLPALAQTTRVRANFDFDWQFHKGDIAIKRAVKVGKQGGLTDADVKVVEGEEAIIAYTDKNKVANYKAGDWRNVDLPHDWLIEESFVHDDNISSQPAGNGYLPTGIGFYRKEFAVAASDLGKKISIEFDGIFRNSTVWVKKYKVWYQ